MIATYSTPTDFDAIILGGGLAGGLLFYGLLKSNPNLKVALIEKNKSFGGNHTWCFHEADIPTSDHWVYDLVSKSWPSYEVRFPSYTREFNSTYNAIRSEDFSKKIVELAEKNENSSIFFGSTVSEFNHQSAKVTFNDNREKVFTAPWIIDARGWPSMKNQLVAFQKFIGLDIEFENPHGQTHALLKDVTITQFDGYRFIYVLPWDSHSLLIEDTYYSDTDYLDESRIEKNLIAEAERRFGKIKRVIRKEIGRLPLPLVEPVLETNPLTLSSHNFAENLKHFESVDQSSQVVATKDYPDPEFVNKTVGNNTPIRLGARSMYFNPVTGYSLPQTLECVDIIVKHHLLSYEDLSSKLNFKIRSQKVNLLFFYILNRMFFRAAAPLDRYKVISRFYKLPQSTIERFYNGRLRFVDKARILVGKPPVPIKAAIKAIMETSS